MTLKENQRGRLETLELIQSESGPTVIILHGYGADASDLASLSQAMAVSPRLNWIFPNAPLHVPIGGGMMGRGWFPIDLEDLQRRMMRGEPRPQELTSESAFKTARFYLSEFVDALDLPFDELVFGGFSQGAMMATDLVLSNSLHAMGLILFSGGLIRESEWSTWAPRHAGLPFFQSHGSADPVLPIEGAKRLAQLLSKAGLQGQLQSFSGGHEIPMAVIQQAAGFLQRKILKMNLK